MAAAATLLSYFKSHADKVHAVQTADARLLAARRVLRWLADRPQVTAFTRRDVYQTLKRSLARPEDLEAPLGLLVAHGCLARVSQMTARSPGWQVNPAWLRLAGE